ncbi:SH3 and multiple ankyrin repeat domains protein 2 isoform X1 [Spodoptera frugiperda]|uniref:SH3 and multiple ankyrin repeat domains protein 2 isoform X1 n=1 Tax=Spodoptera frugiperda TaxID=7108 RepID=A0A9R0EA22_SPOFR|nr:SH3 and multiple ankyrin repeat domains protein 2 isoform X1 [Spodoptera frugiperda]XP_050561186.1 SH3 and multiple ankyrin repeat domains protein 2 isoform X1 [Spodoptera frugiperda]
MEGECSEGAEGWLLVRVHVPELNVQKSLQFPRDQLIWDVKQQCLAALPKVATWYRELKESFNYGLFCPPVNGKAGKFLDEERRLGDYPFNGPVGYLELKYKRRVYKMLKLDEKTLKALHSRANLRRFLEHVTHAQIDKITKACAKGLDPNFHCQETGETPLTIAAGLKTPGKVLIALVNGGALLDYRTKDGSTAMHRAIEKNSLEAVKTLLELGASPNYKDGKGLTPLYLSVTNKTDPLLCETLLHDHATIGATDLQGWQEVHQACRNGLVQHLDHLLFYGADMNSRNASGNTPLHVCAVNAQDSCARQLLFRGCDKEALNFANQTPYQVAVIAGNLDLAEVIKNYKAEEVVPFRGPPRYNPKRRSAAWGGWWTAGDRSSLASSTRIPAELDTLLRRQPGPTASPCSLERPFSSASSSISDASHPSHEDDASILTDKSAGDTSDIISDSSGVGTSNSDTTCSLHGGATVVCLQPYDAGTPGHVRLNQGDIVEVTGATDDGLLEGTVRGSGASGLFPMQCVQEVRLRQNTHNLHQVLASGPIHHSRVTGRREMALSKTYSATAPRIKKSYGNMETRTVVLHRARRGFGFVLRGAKASSPLMELRPSERCPALQYLDDVDAGGVADRAGLKKGDFLVAINGEDVSCASHEHVVELIRSSGALVSMTVVSLNNHNGNNENNTCTVPTSKSQNQLSSSGRPYAATLPRKGAGGRAPAPAPPRRDPRTTLSVGRARAKSMVAGLENGGEKEESCEPLSVAGKSSSAESVQLPGGSNSGTPVSGTPVAPRTASIRARPASSRITAAELEELFQRQADADTILGNNAMMTRSAFQGGSNSPPYSPARAPTRVYASVAEMKRSRGKLWSKSGSSTLRRDFHSTPDLAAEHTAHPPRTRSSEDVHAPGRVPPPACPPPPPPIAGAAPASTFRPADQAKLYASPRDLDTVAYRPTATDNTHNGRKATSLRSWAGPNRPQSADETGNQYAQPFNTHKGFVRQNSTPAPPIPEPDYSMSESDDEVDSKPKGEPAAVAETSANSNASGSSSGSSSMQHSFSVDEIQKIRTRLKSSKSCGDELGVERDDGDNSSSGVSSDQEAQARPPPRRDKVSFCASVTVKSSNDVISTEPVHSSSESLAPPPPPMARHNSLTRKRATAAVLRGAGGAARGRSAAERLGVDIDKAPGRRARAAVLLAALPPPPEEAVAAPEHAPVLAPPPQFSDRVRVVAALPKRLAHLQ